MSDLLSPILYVMEDESEAFWCFAALMERMAPNFHRDQNGMHSQLLAISKVFVTGLICWWCTSSLFLRMYCRSSSLSFQLNVNINSFAFSWPRRVLRYVIVSFSLRIEYFVGILLALSFFLWLLFPHKAMDVWSPLSSLLGFGVMVRLSFCYLSCMVACRLFFSSVLTSSNTCANPHMGGSSQAMKLQSLTLLDIVLGAAGAVAW